MTKAQGITIVLTTYLIETFLSLTYLLLLLYSSITSLLLATSDAITKNGKLEQRKAQYETQINVALLMLCSLVVLFNLGRGRGMWGMRRSSSEDIGVQSYYYLRKVKGERMGRSSRKGWGERCRRMVMRVVVYHMVSMAVVFFSVVLAANLGPHDHLLSAT